MKIENKDQLIKMFDILYNKHPDKDIDFYKMLMAVELLRILVDNEWVNQTIFFDFHAELSRTNRDAYEFFGSKNLGYLWQEKVFRLSERLLNLRNIVNFDLIVKDIKNGELVSRYAEIEVACHLYKRLIKFEFVKPSGNKGADFDIKIIDNLEVNCEVKHKIEETDFSAKTIEKSLSKANKQIPQNNPAIIFIKFPTKWTEENQYLNIITSACTPFLIRNKNHIIAIVFRWQKNFLDGKMVNWMYKVLRNPDYSHNEKTFEVLNKLELWGNNPEWINLEGLIKEQLNLKEKITANISQVY